MKNIFFDFNNWLYLLLIFPLYEVIKKETLNKLLQIFTASVSWLILETFFLLFVFSHNLLSIAPGLYRWIRTSGVGEITQMQGGFSRIFFQSHIFNLIAFFIFAIICINFYLNKKHEGNKKQLLLYYSFLTLNLSVLLISLSRSFWVGLLAGISIIVLIVVRLLAKKNISWQRFLYIFAGAIISLVLSVAVIAVIIKFPYPRAQGSFSADLADRLSDITDEAAVSSRWSLLPNLWGKVKENPILGKGFGTTVTYMTSDPRALKLNQGGQYTTYAFEWGWLDIWLKIGLLGVISYVVLLLKPFKYSKIDIKSDNYLVSAILLNILVISIVNFFTPYLNHPLGLGYLMISILIVDVLQD